MFSLLSVLLALHRFLVALMLMWLWGGVFFAAYIGHLEPPDSSLSTNAVVIFTGEGGRLKSALEFCQRHPCSLMHISGIHPDVALSLAQTKVSPKTLISHDLAHNTRENVQQTLTWIQHHHIRSIRLFTSDYHMPRCLLEASRWGIPIVPHPLSLKVTAPKRLRLIFWEYNKYLLTLMSYLFPPLKASFGMPEGIIHDGLYTTYPTLNNWDSRTAQDARRHHGPYAP